MDNQQLHQQWLANQDLLVGALLNVGFVVVDTNYDDGTPKRVSTFSRGKGRTLVETSVNFVDHKGNTVVAEDPMVWNFYDLVDYFWDNFEANGFKVTPFVFPGVRVVRCRRDAKTGAFNRSEGKPSKMYATPDLVRSNLGKTKELPVRFDPWNKKTVSAEHEFGEIWLAL